jgi:spore germination protein KC/spore germination protein
MRKVMLLIICLILMLSTGCWDRVEIETRGYVIGVAIDDYPPIPKGQVSNAPEEASAIEDQKFETSIPDTGAPTYAMTIQFPIIKKATASAKVGGGGGAGQGSRTWELTQIGNSFAEMNEELSTRTELIPYYEHLQAIVVSESVARKGLEDVIDLFVRDPEMRRRVKFFISTGEAKSILDVIPRIEDYSSVYLAKLQQNAKVSSKIFYKTDLGAVVVHIHADEDFMLPVVDATKDEIKERSAAVFKNGKMIGSLDEIEAETVMLITNCIKGGILTAASPDNPNGIISLRITNASVRIIPIIDEKGCRFKINIKITGNYAENTHVHTHGRLDEEYLRKAEIFFNKATEERSIKSIKKIQMEYGADIFHFCRVLKSEKPAYWKTVKDRWREIFPNVPCEVHVETTIKQIGNIR